MPELIMITDHLIPDNLYATNPNIVIRLLYDEERILIEDKLSNDLNEVCKLNNPSSAVIYNGLRDIPALIDDQILLTEFALSMITEEGYTHFYCIAIVTKEACTFARLIPSSNAVPMPRYVETMNGEALCQWIEKCINVRRKIKEKFYIIADRYLRSIKSKIPTDALLDLCISLESLINSQTEVSFRFCMCLTKFSVEDADTNDDISETKRLLHDLYNVRSRIVHGDTNALKNTESLWPNYSRLIGIARRILTRYILFMSEKTHKQWDDHMTLILLRREALNGNDTHEEAAPA